MCLICEFPEELALNPHRFAPEKRAAEMVSAILDVMANPGDDKSKHLQDDLIERGFTLVEIKDGRAAAMLMLWTLVQRGHVKLPPRIRRP